MGSTSKHRATHKKEKRASDPACNDQERERRKRGKANLPAVNPIATSRVQELLTECSERLFNSCILQKTCCICDCFLPASIVKNKCPRRCEVLLRAMRTRLKPPRGLQPELEAQYDVSDIDPAFAGMLLSRRGIVRDGPRTIMQLCEPRLVSLSRKTVTSAPKFAIANGLYMGQLPDPYNDSTMTENATVNLSQPTRFLAVVQGGRHTTIRSHAYYFRSEPAPPAVLLPVEVISKGTIGVTMVGSKTPIQKAATLRHYTARVPRLFEQLGWYMLHNRLYDNIGVAGRSHVESFETSTAVVMDCTRDDESYDGAVNEPEGEQSTTATTYAARAAGVEASLHVKESSVRNGLVAQLDQSHLRHNELCPAHLTATTLAAENMEQSALALVTNFAMEDDIELTRRVLDNANAGVVVRRSSVILSDFDPEFWIYSF